MNTDARYRIRADDGRYAGYGLGPLSVSLAGEDTAYVFAQRVDADEAASKFSAELGEAVSVVEYPAVDGEVRVGDVVRFAAPVTTDEEGERFEVLEHRGDRALVRLVESGMRIEPTFVCPLNELVNG